MALQTTIERAKKWLKSSPPGSRLLYYEGMLASDRETLDFENGHLLRRLNKPVEEVANLMWAAYAMGKVILVQERTGKGEFRYWAHKVRR